MPVARFLVSGRVQGVGYRWFTARAARSLGVVGWARNTDDGTVEVVAAAADATLADFDAALRRGPTGSRVERVVRTPATEPVDGLPDPFAIVS